MKYKCILCLGLGLSLTCFNHKCVCICKSSPIRRILVSRLQGELKLQHLKVNEKMHVKCLFQYFTQHNSFHNKNSINHLLKTGRKDDFKSKVMACCMKRMWTFPEMTESPPVCCHTKTSPDCQPFRSPYRIPDHYAPLKSSAQCLQSLKIRRSPLNSM